MTKSGWKPACSQPSAISFLTPSLWGRTHTIVHSIYPKKIMGQRQRNWNRAWVANVVRKDSEIPWNIFQACFFRTIFIKNIGKYKLHMFTLMFLMWFFCFVFVFWMIDTMKSVRTICQLLSGEGLRDYSYKTLLLSVLSFEPTAVSIHILISSCACLLNSNLFVSKYDLKK